MIRDAQKSLTSIKLFALCLAVVISCLGGIQPARADDPSAITGWQNFQFGMMYSDAIKLCDTGRSANLIAPVLSSTFSFTNHGGYAGVACKSATILGVKFDVNLRFTLSGYLYEIALDTPDFVETDKLSEVQNALQLKYGSNFDTTSDTLPPGADGATMTSSGTYWPSQYSEPTTVNLLQVRTVDNPPGPIETDTRNVYRLDSQMNYYSGGREDGKGLYHIHYYADQGSYNQWISQPTIFQLSAGGQL